MVSAHGEDRASVKRRIECNVHAHRTDEPDEVLPDRRPWWRGRDIGVGQAVDAPEAHLPGDPNRRVEGTGLDTGPEPSDSHRTDCEGRPRGDLDVDGGKGSFEKVDEAGRRGPGHRHTTIRTGPSSRGLPLAEVPPRTRGCAPANEAPPYRGRGSPAHAGMRPAATRGSASATGFPRARGDAPDGATHRARMPKVPPRTRGCARAVPDRQGTLTGSPAHAGMRPGLEVKPAGGTGFPRARGDAPGSDATAATSRVVPPRTRGCARLD